MVQSQITKEYIEVLKLSKIISQDFKYKSEKKKFSKIAFYTL